MRKLALKSVGIFSLFLLSFGLMSMADDSARRPMFGSSTSTWTEPCGECTCTYAQTTTYIFWIGFTSPAEITKTNC